jgi:hypothetical protein
LLILEKRRKQGCGLLAVIWFPPLAPVLVVDSDFAGCWPTDIMIVAQNVRKTVGF